jgi:hypothetical protein
MASSTLIVVAVDFTGEFDLMFVDVIKDAGYIDIELFSHDPSCALLFVPNTARPVSPGRHSWTKWSSLNNRIWEMVAA